MISENYFKSAQVSDLYGHIMLVTIVTTVLVTDSAISYEYLDFITIIFKVSPTLGY